MGQVSRRALLARAGIGTGAGVFALLGATAAPAFGAASSTDLANVRLVCAAKRVAINWYTQWVNTPAAVADSTEADLIRAVRKQEQGHYATLAPLLDGTAPIDDDYTFTFPKGALRSPTHAVAFAVDLEAMMLGLVVGAAARTVDPDVSATLTSIVGGRRPAPQRSVGARRRLGPRGRPAARARHRRRRQPACPVPLELGGTHESHLLHCGAPAAACSLAHRAPDRLHGRSERASDARRRRR